MSLASGAVCWGHDTGVTEDYTRDFDGNWTGTGDILNAGVVDLEAIGLDSGEEKESDTWHVGSGNCYITTDKYASGGGSGSVQYKTGNSRVVCDADTWHAYTGPFNSLGWVRVKLLVA